jgi:hypothetical protein
MFLFSLAYGGIWQTPFILVLVSFISRNLFFFFLSNIALQKNIKNNK